MSFGEEVTVHAANSLVSFIEPLLGSSRKWKEALRDDTNNGYE